MGGGGQYYFLLQVIPNYLKGCNTGAACSLLMDELILDDKPKGFPLITSHGIKVLICCSILNVVWQMSIIES